MQTERQKEIVSVALELISKKGIQGFTIKNLANKIGITEPAIYRHYDNKISILIAILDLFKYNAGQIISKELMNENLAIEKIEQIFIKYLTIFSKNPSFVSVIFSEEIFKNEPVLINKIYEIIGKNQKNLIEIISQGQKNGDIRIDIEASHLSIIIMGTLRLFVKKWQFSDYSFDLLKEGENIVKAIKLLINK